MYGWARDASLTDEHSLQQGSYWCSTVERPFKSILVDSIRRGQGLLEKVPVYQPGTKV